jgi:hypothetical protein
MASSLLLLVANVIAIGLRASGCGRAIRTLRAG